MKNTNEKKALAVEITRKYAITNQTMAEIAANYKKKENLAFKVSSDKIVSKCIYFCIFFGLIDEEEEEIIINKIVENQRRHCMHVKSSNNDFLKKKYFELLDDKKEYLKCLDTLSLINQYDELKAELDYSLSVNPEDFVASEDAPYYKPPRDPDIIKEEIKKCVKILEENKIKVCYISYEKSAREEIIGIIEKKWSL